MQSAVQFTHSLKCGMWFGRDKFMPLERVLMKSDHTATTWTLSSVSIFYADIMPPTQLNKMRNM